MKSLWTFFLVFVSISLFAQKQNSSIEYVPNQFIIQLDEATDAESFFQKFYNQLGESGIAFFPENHFSKSLNLFLLQPKNDIVDTEQFLNNLRTFPEINIAAQNFKVNTREKIPNDPIYTSQWGMDLIKAPEVWDFTTGGVTALGDTIVVAMIEPGDWRHDDLVDNVWINWNEVNNDGIDNDNNGFIDDYFGWNVLDSSDVIGSDPLGHGVLVGGIIGAKGDNNIGISGVNWNVKIMWVHHLSLIHI